MNMFEHGALAANLLAVNSGSVYAQMGCNSSSVAPSFCGHTLVKYIMEYRFPLKRCTSWAQVPLNLRGLKPRGPIVTVLSLPGEVVLAVLAMAEDPLGGLGHG